MFYFFITFWVNDGLSLSLPLVAIFLKQIMILSWIIGLDFIDKLSCAHKVSQLIVKISQFWGFDATVVKRTSY